MKDKIRGSMHTLKYRKELVQVHDLLCTDAAIRSGLKKGFSLEI